MQLPKEFSQKFKKGSLPLMLTVNADKKDFFSKCDQILNEKLESWSCYQSEYTNIFHSKTQ